MSMTQDTPSPVVCVHASASSGRQWTGLARSFEADRALAAPDLGAGVGRDSLEKDIEIVEAAIASAGVPVHLIGHSYGGAVAALAALRNPGSVASLALWEPVCFWLLRDDARGASEASRRSAAAWGEISAVAAGLAADREIGRIDRAAREFVDYWSGRGSWAALDERRQQAVMQRMDSVQSNFERLFEELAPIAAFSRLAMPVAWLSGACARKPVHRIGELLRKALPGMRRHVVPGVGHMGPVTHPVLVGSLLAAFVVASESQRRGQGAAREQEHESRLYA